MAFDKKFLLATTFIAGFAMAAPALAQTQAQPAPAQSAADDEEDDSSVEEVVVTGSRIRRNEFTSAAPITVITAEQAQLEGLVDTAELLQTSSVASGSFQINNQLTGFVVEGGGAVNSISLRGLGQQRTLVLLNGRRLGPAGTQGQVGAVDLNVIPSSIIERTEILKDGASSIYGSDAVAGVINLITRTNLDGFNAQAYINQTERGGGSSFRHSGSYCQTFDRGYFNIALDMQRQEILRRRDREQTSCTKDYLFNPTNNYSEYGWIDADTGEIQCLNILNNVIRTSTAGDLVLTALRPGYAFPTAQQGNNSPFAGTARTFRAGFPATFPYYESDHPEYGAATIFAPLDIYSAFGTFGFDLTPTTEVYGEMLLSRRESETDSLSNIAPSLPASNPNNRQPNGTTFGQTILPIVVHSADRTQEVNYTRFVGGIRGEFGSMPFLSGWDWDLFTQFARSEGEYTVEFKYADRLAALSQPGVACVDFPANRRSLERRGSAQRVELQLLDAAGRCDPVDLAACPQRRLHRSGARLPLRHRRRHHHLRPPGG
jgi:iron complex outermembrane receptor protein